jgi:hypothetical protein
VNRTARETRPLEEAQQELDEAEVVLSMTSSEIQALRDLLSSPQSVLKSVLATYGSVR